MNTTINTYAKTKNKVVSFSMRNHAINPQILTSGDFLKKISHTSVQSPSHAASGLSALKRAILSISIRGIIAFAAVSSQ